MTYSDCDLYDAVLCNSIQKFFFNLSTNQPELRLEKFRVKITVALFLLSARKQELNNIVLSTVSSSSKKSPEIYYFEVQI